MRQGLHKSIGPEIKRELLKGEPTSRRYNERFSTNKLEKRSSSPKSWRDKFLQPFSGSPSSPCMCRSTKVFKWLLEEEFQKHCLVCNHLKPWWWKNKCPMDNTTVPLQIVLNRSASTVTSPNAARVQSAVMSFTTMIWLRQTSEKAEKTCPSTDCLKTRSDPLLTLQGDLSSLLEVLTGAHLL